MKQRALVLALLMATIVHGAQIFNLYSDQRAMQVGDILTVMIVENAKAGSNSSTSTGSKTGFGIDNVSGSGSLDFIPSFGGSGSMGSDYEGGGDTRREQSLVATLSVRIDQVYENGNLLISGNKTVEINDEQEIIRLSGMVRPLDIEADNTIYSFNIANAEITYSGDGEVDDARRAGPFARFFNWLF